MGRCAGDLAPDRRPLAEVANRVVERQAIAPGRLGRRGSPAQTAAIREPSVRPPLWEAFRNRTRARVVSVHYRTALQISRIAVSSSRPAGAAGPGGGAGGH